MKSVISRLSLPPARERIESRSFPSIFAWGASDSTLELDHLTPAERVALHDLNFGVVVQSNLGSNTNRTRCRDSALHLRETLNGREKHTRRNFT